MKFTIKRNDVLSTFARVQGLAGRKTNLVITTNVLIEAIGSHIIVRATDLETGYEGMFPAAVESEGTIAINARKLFEIVRDFPNEEISVNEIENHWIEIGHQKVEYHLVGMNPEDFPKIPHFDDVEYLSIESAVLAAMIEKTVYIVGASDDKRAHIIGILLETIEQNGQKKLRMVSTDGSRMAKIDGVYEGAVLLPESEVTLVPKKGLYEIAKFLDADGSVGLGVKDNNLVIKKKNETLIIRLLEGEFPEYDDIIKKREDSISVAFTRQPFLMMLKRMSILSTEDYRSVIFNFKDDRLIVTSTNPDIGESKEEMNITFNSEPIEAAFNPRYFIEALNVIEQDNVTLDIVNDQKPCILAGVDEHNFLTVIMPMRV
ncbi:MAG: DNA polymerase III subunit beta [Desulfobacterales bacterium]